MQVGVRQNTSGQMQVAPITGSNKGLQRAEIKQGIREVITCKDGDGKLGLRLRHVNNVSLYCKYYAYKLQLLNMINVFVNACADVDKIFGYT